MKDFRTLLVWRKAHELSLAVYKNTPVFQWMRSMDSRAK